MTCKWQIWSNNHKHQSKELLYFTLYIISFNISSKCKLQRVILATGNNVTQITTKLFFIFIALKPMPQENFYCLWLVAMPNQTLKTPRQCFIKLIRSLKWIKIKSSESRQKLFCNRKKVGKSYLKVRLFVFAGKYNYWNVSVFSIMCNFYFSTATLNRTNVSQLMHVWVTNVLGSAQKGILWMFCLCSYPIWSFLNSTEDGFKLKTVEIIQHLGEYIFVSWISIYQTFCPKKKRNNWIFCHHCDNCHPHPFIA